MASRVIQVLLEENYLEGIKTVYASNTGIVATIVNRADVHKVKHVIYKDNPGVYILIGDNIYGVSTIYIGESDKIGDRILKHSKDEKKSFWNEVIFFTSNTESDTSVSKSHIKYIENKLYTIAKESANVRLTETQITPQKPKISRIDEALADEFLDNILFILKALRYDLFTPTNSTSNLNKILNPDINGYIASEIFTYKVRKAEARMRIISGKYVLLKDSTLVNGYRDSAAEFIKNRREDLKERGFINIKSDETLIVVQDIPCNTSSMAASLVCGGHASGNKMWKVAGKMLKDIENLE